MEMDYKKILEDLEKRYEEFETQYKEIETDWIADFEGTQDYHTYMSYTEDEVKKTMYPEWFEKEQQMKDLKKKIVAFEKDVIVAASNVNKQLDESIQKIESKLKVNEDYIKGLNEKIENQQQEINTLKQSEAYINGDEATRLQVEELEAELVAKTYRRDTVAQDIFAMQEELAIIKVKKEELLEKYGEEIEAYDNSSKETPDEKSQDENEGKDEKDEKSKGKKERTSNGGVVLPDANSNPAELSPEEKAKKEQEEKAKKLKEDFADLSSKAKKGKLTDKELDSFIDILKDKDNYDKLGLSMGLIFNKPRGIFKALNKKYKDDETKLASINEAYSIYEEKFFEKHGKEKLEKLSKFFVIDEVEHEKKTPILRAAAEEHEGAGGNRENNNPLGAELAGGVVGDGEYVDISSSSRKKGELDRGEK